MKYALTHARTRGRPVERVLAVTSGLLATASWFGFTGHSPDSTSLGVVFFGLAATGLFVIGRLRMTTRDSTLSIHGLDQVDGIVWTTPRDGARSVPKSSLVAGYRTGPSSAILREKDGRLLDFTLEDPDPGAVDRLLGALDLDVGQRANAIELPHRVGSFVVMAGAYLTVVWKTN